MYNTMSENKVVKVVDRIEDIVLVAMFALMVGSIFLQVIMRYIFNNSLSWSEELGKFMFIWLSWVGISIGQRRGEHIKIELLVAKLPYRGAMVCNILSDLIVIAICAVTGYYGVVLAINQHTTHYAGIGISISWGYISVTVGCALMVFRCIVTMIQSGKNYKAGKPPEGEADSLTSSTEFVHIEMEGGDD